jgi:sec-independent protein translocase protein TatB
MFGIDSAELLIIAVVALVVIGPKDLPRVMRTVGGFVARARGMAGQFRLGLDNMVRETELADMERQWKEQNDRIMQQHPAVPESPVPESDWGTAPAAAQDEAQGAAPVGDWAATPPPPPPPARAASPRIPARSGPRPPAGGRRAPLPPRPRELP